MVSHISIYIHKITWYNKKDSGLKKLGSFFVCERNDTYILLVLYVYILRCYNRSDNFISDNYGETIGGNYAK